MARFQRGSILSYNRAYYMFADSARNIPDPRAEYRKIRNAALNRIRKLERAGYGDTETVQRARRVFEAQPRNLTQDEAAQRLPDAARFITAARGTVGGMREIERRTANTFHDRGLKFVNRRNVRQFTEFLEWLGTSKVNELFGSEQVAERAPREGDKERRGVKVKDIQQMFQTWLRENDY